MKINPYKKEEDVVFTKEKETATSPLQKFLDRRLRKTESVEQASQSIAATEETTAAEVGKPISAPVSTAAGTQQELSALARSATLDAWYKQAEALRAKNPDFNLQAYTENPVFMALLEDGLSVFDAFELSRLAQSRRNRENTPAPALERVRENGITAQSGITLRPDVSRLTPQERANIARRAAKGEKVIL